MTNLPLAIRKSWGFFAPHIGTGFPLPRPCATTTKKNDPLETRPPASIGWCMIDDNSDDIL